VHINSKVRLDQAVADLAETSDLAPKANRRDSSCGIIGIVLNANDEDTPTPVC